MQARQGAAIKEGADEMIPDYMVALANHLWQSTLFVVAVWLMVLTLRKNRAALRHRLWLAASVKFLVPFSLLAGVGSHLQWNTPSLAPPVRLSVVIEAIGQPFSASDRSVVPTATMTRPPDSRLPSVRIVFVVLIGVWICGVAVSVLLWCIGWRRIHRAVRLATPGNLNGRLRVMYSSEDFEPGVFGILNPVLLLPEGMNHHLSPAQMEAVLAHELCHVRRRDNMTMAMHMIVEALLWFHPLVWWIRLRLVEEQELACDEEVLRHGTEAAVYAETLLRVCEFYVELPSTCVSGITGQNLRKRVERIVRNQIGESLYGWRKIVLAAASIAAVVTPVLSGSVSAPPKLTQRSQSLQVSFMPSGASPLMPLQPLVTPAERPVAAAPAVQPQRPTTAPSQSQLIATRTQVPVAAEAERAMEQALRSREAVTDLMFLTETNYFQLNRAEYFVPVTLKIPGAQFGSAGRVFVDIVGEVTDAYGTRIHNLRDAVDVRRSNDTANDLSMRQIVYDAGFTLLPGQYSVKFLIRDAETGRMGIRETTVVIPNLSREAQNLPISSVVLSTELSNMNVPADSQLAMNPLMIEGKKLIPSVTRELSRGRDLFVYLQAYEPDTSATEPLTAFVTFYRDQTQVFETAALTVKDDLGRKLRTLPVLLRVPLTSLPAGAYDCQVTVLNPATRKSAVWRSPISVVN
jgi:beta-lactamase regulating signal transducer with metallopeptidase domain